MIVNTIRRKSKKNKARRYFMKSYVIKLTYSAKIKKQLKQLKQLKEIQSVTASHMGIVANDNYKSGCSACSTVSKGVYFTVENLDHSLNSKPSAR